MRIISTIFLFFLLFSGYSQNLPYTPGTSPRSNPSVVPEDYNASFRANLYIPRFNDTLQANTYTKFDTCGRIIYTYDDNRLWVRGCSPKRWIEKGKETTLSFSNGIYDSLGIVGWGAGVVNKSTFNSWRYVNTNGNREYRVSRSSSLLLWVDSSLAGGGAFATFKGPYGGTINFESDTSARTFNTVNWYKQGVFQAGFGQDVGPSTNHMYLDMRAGVLSFNFENASGALSQFNTDGKVFLGLQGRINLGPSGTIGGQRANVIGSFSVSDSTRLWTPLGSSGDSVLTKTTGGLLRAISASSLLTQNFANADLTFTGDRIHDLNSHSLLLENGTAIQMETDNSIIMQATSSANVAIGTSSPTSVIKLQVIANPGTFAVGGFSPAGGVGLYGETSNSFGVQGVATASGGSGIYGSSTGVNAVNIAGQFVAQNGSLNVALAVPAASGRTGLGTVTPSVQLEVVDNSSSDQIAIISNTNSSGGGLLVQGTATNTLVPLMLVQSGSPSFAGRFAVYANGRITAPFLNVGSTANRLVGWSTVTGDFSALTLPSVISSFTFPDSLKVIDAYEYGVVFDGTTDNITALRNMRNAAARTGWPLRFGPGVVTASDSVTFTEMVLVGNNTTIKTTSTSLTIFYIKDSNDVQGFNFIGTGKGSSIPVGVFTLQNGIRVFGSGNVIHNCVFTSLNGSGITLWNSSQIRSNNIYGCRFNTNTIGVYAMSNNEYTSIDNNFFEDNYVGGYERSSSNCMWKNNTFEFDDNACFRVRGDGADHGKFVNNTVNHGGTYGIYFENNAISYLVNDNYIYSSNIGIGVDDTCHNVQFSHNVIANSTISGTKNVRVRIFDNTYISPVTESTTGVTYYNNWASSDPTLAHPDSIVFSQPGGYYRFTNMISSIDTTTYKWVGMDVNGKIVRGNSWGNLKLPIVVGTTVIQNGTTTNIIYNNAGVVGEYTITGSGTVVAMQTTPTFVTRITTPIVTGSPTANGTLQLMGNNAGAGNTAANSNIILSTGNTPTNALVINNAQEIGIGTNPATGNRMFIVSAGNNNSTTHSLYRNSSTQNIFQLSDLGNTYLGNQSTAGNQINLYGRTYAGNGIGAQITPSALLHIAAGAAGVSNAPLKFTSGTSLTSAEAGAMEFTTDDLFFTITTGTARKRFLFGDPVGGLTSGRVPFVTTNGRLTDDAGFTYSTSTGLVGAGMVSTAALGANITTVTTTTTADGTHYTILVDASGGAVTINLPAANTATRRIYVVKKIDAAANNVTLDGSGAETIDGAATQIITTQWASYTIQSNGTAWFIL